MNTYSYTFKEYESDVKSLKNTLSNIENLHLIAVFRGSIPLVVHLSNLLDCEMSIIKLQTSNGCKTKPQFLSIQFWQPDALLIELLSTSTHHPIHFLFQ